MISDTSWPGYDVVPPWVIDGYATIFAEIDDQLAAADLPRPGVVLVPIGVGAFAAAAAQWYRRPGLAAPPRADRRRTGHRQLRDGVRAGR